MNKQTESIESSVKTCISKAVLVPAEDISLDDTYHHLAVLELDRVEIVMNLETEFDITISDDEMLQLSTVQQCLDLVLSKL